MRPRTLLLFAFVALMGAAAAVPALATASGATLEVSENCVELEWPCWTTEGSAFRPQPTKSVMIASGGTVTFIDHGKKANIAWTGTPTGTPPPCEPSVPVSPTPPTTPWEGKCTFATSGIYNFESSTLFKQAQSAYGNNIDYTKYEIVVAGTPTDATTLASGETQTEAMLNGSIDPKGNTVAYHFEYEGPGVTGGKQSTPAATLSATDFASHPVSAAVTGLLPNKTYHFELIATYGAGKTAVPGGEQTFITPAPAAPTATTTAATVKGQDEATLNGEVDPHGGNATEYFFEYGTSESYGEKTTTETGFPVDNAEHPASATVHGLRPGTTYHFRLVAKNAVGGPINGVDRTFKTESLPAPKEPPSPTTTTTTTPPSPPTTTTTTPIAAPPPGPPIVGGPSLAGSTARLLRARLDRNLQVRHRRTSGDRPDLQ